MTNTKNNAIRKAMRAIETLCRADPSVYSLGQWVGKELSVTMDNLDKGYIGFQLNDDDTKYKIRTFNCFPELNNVIVVLYK